MAWFKSNNNVSDTGYDAEESPLNARLHGRRNTTQQTDSYVYAEQEKVEYCYTCGCNHFVSQGCPNQKRGWFSRG